MKKELLYYLILIVIIAGMMLVEANIISGKSLQNSRVIDEAYFEKLDIDLNCNIYVSIGDEQKVVLGGTEQSLKHIEARLERGTLTLRSKGHSILGSLLEKNATGGEINIYLQLTASNQLISPKRGRIITNETLIFGDLDCASQYSFNQRLLGILGLLSGQQVCFIPSNLL